MNGPRAKHSADGNAYGRPAHTHNSVITETGPGTPCGELMRRYWHPVEMSDRLHVRPRKLSVLNEDVVLFRDLAGRPGRVTPSCAHRGADLYFGKVDENGIRWPVSIAPFEVVVAPVRIGDAEQAERAEGIYSDLREAGFDALLDDRDERPGVKFKDADLIGFPLRIVPGPRSLAKGCVELVDRVAGESVEVPLADLVAEARRRIR